MTVRAATSKMGGMVRRYKTKTLPRGILIDRGYVYIRIFPQGKLFQECFGRVTEEGVIDDAKTKLDEYRKDIRLKKFDFADKERRITFEEAAEAAWKLHFGKLKASGHYAHYLKTLCDCFPGRYIDGMTYLDVEHFRREKEKKLSVATVNKMHATLTTLFNKFKTWKRQNVIKPVKLPAENPGSLVSKGNERIYARKRVLSVDEFKRLLECGTICTRRIVLGAVNSTLRLKDLKGLTRAHINAANNTLVGLQAKTGKPFSVPINGVLAELIATAPGQRIFDFTNWRKLFNQARTRAGLKDFQFRDLRRTGARMMLAKGIDLATVSAFLGHASLKMTEVYVTPSKDDAAAAGEILGSMYRWKPGEPGTELSEKLSEEAKVSGEKISANAMKDN